MCIQGANSLENLGVYISVPSGFAAGISGFLGLVLGICSGWSGLPIGLITAGGVLLTAGVGGGCALTFRAAHLKDNEREKITQACTSVWKGNKNFDD